MGERPPVSQINLNILEHRLLVAKSKRVAWFGVDGCVDSLPDPLRKAMVQPWHLNSERIDKSLEVVYVKASKTFVEDKYLKVRTEGKPAWFCAFPSGYV